MKCEDCKVDLYITPYKYEGKTVYECPKCEDEYV